MSDTHVEATRETFAGRAKGSCAGAVFGVFVLVGAVFLLTWNERRGAVRGRALDEGERVVAVASADRIDAGHEGSLVHVTGLATTTETLRDAELGVAETALRLRRLPFLANFREPRRQPNELPPVLRPRPLRATPS